jgi:hypothetical protein
MRHSKLYQLFLLGGLAFFGIAATQMSGGPDPGFTGAPGERNCTMCHMGNANSGADETILEFPKELERGYKPGQTYDMSLITEVAGTERFGVQLTALTGTGAMAGTLTLVNDDLKKETQNGKQYLTHTRNGSTNGVANGKKIWNFKWTAPATNVGKVTFYTAWMASNNNGRNDSGDKVYTPNFSFDADPTSVAPKALPDGWTLGPNPSDGDFQLRFNTTDNTPIELSVVNVAGQVVYAKEWTSTGSNFDQTIALGHLSKGIYMAQINVGGKQYVERLIVK